MNKKFIVFILSQITIIAENPKDVARVLNAVSGKPFQDPVNVKNTFNTSDKKNCICKNCDFSHGASLKGKNLEGCDLEGSNFEGADLTRANFTGAILHGANFKNATCQECDFSSATGTKFLPFQAYNAVPVISKVRNSRPNLAEQKGVSFENATLTASKFVNSKFQNANFSNANLDNVSFLYAQLQQSKFLKAKAYNAIFKGSNLEGVNMHNMQPTNILDETIQSRLVYTAGHSSIQYQVETSFQMPMPINFCGTRLPNGQLFSIYNSATCTNEQMAKYGDLKHQKIN